MRRFVRLLQQFVIALQRALRIDLALRDGYSTKNSLGLGLPGARRLMDDFDLASEIGHGTRVTMKKWKR